VCTKLSKMTQMLDYTYSHNPKTQQCEKFSNKLKLSYKVFQELFLHMHLNPQAPEKLMGFEFLFFKNTKAS